MNFPQNASKTRERHSLAEYGSLCGEKQFLLTFIPCKKQLFKQIQIFLTISRFSNMVRKKISEYFSALFWDSPFFWLKRKVLYEFPPNCFKTTESHSLAVCGSICGEKQFLLIFIPFYLFDKKQLFKQIKNFLRISPFQTW